jgi:flagellar M-ring protein FliF
MDRLRKQIDEISARLKTLNVSQRIAIAMCAGMVLISMLWLMQWSTAPEMGLLVNREFTYAELDAAEESLKANGVAFDLRGNRIFVEVSQRHNALRLLHKADALPDGSLYDMQSVVSEQNPFLAPDDRNFRQNFATGNELAKIIATSPFVESASVLLNPKTKRRLGGQSDMPTASVAVTLSGRGEMTEAMVDGFAKLVSGAVAGLKPHNVFITDTRSGRSYNIPHPDDVASFDVLGMQKKRETHLQSKIVGALSYIPGVRVAVSVELEMSKRMTETMQHDAPQPKIETSETSEQGSQGGASESGVQANVGNAVTAGGAGQKNLTENSKTENYPPTLTQREVTEDVPFATKTAKASIGIPRSFVASLYRARFPDKETVADDDPVFVKLQDDQVAGVLRTVEQLVMSTDGEDVEVYVYPDMDWSIEGGARSAFPGAVAVAGQDGMDAMAMAKSYGPQIGLGMLSLFSMFMMMRVVKSVPRLPELADVHDEDEVEPGNEEVLTAGAHPIGKASVTESLLVGQEVDDDTLRYQELGEEVSKLVGDDPHGAAELIRRWMDDA